MDVLRAALAVAEYYGIEDEVGAALERSVANAVSDGLSVGGRSRRAGRR
jgi:hypothetical protein